MMGYKFSENPCQKMKDKEATEENIRVNLWCSPDLRRQMHLYMHYTGVHTHTYTHTFTTHTHSLHTPIIHYTLIH